MFDLAVDAFGVLLCKDILPLHSCPLWDVWLALDFLSWNAPKALFCLTLCGSAITPSSLLSSSLAGTEVGRGAEPGFSAAWQCWGQMGLSVSAWRWRVALCCEQAASSGAAPLPAAQSPSCPTAVPLWLGTLKCYAQRRCHWAQAPHALWPPEKQCHFSQQSQETSSWGITDTALLLWFGVQLREA